MAEKTLLIVDGNALFYRAYHAFPKELSSPSGEVVGAVYGFARIFLSTIKTLKPTHVAVAFDMSGGTFRHEQYAGYKATRDKMPEDLAAQSPRIWEIAQKLEAPIYAAQNFEADDCIGTIAKQVVEQYKDVKVIILSGDQDLIQLVNDRVYMYAPGLAQKQPTLYTPEKVMEKYQFSPSQMVDYKALRGDPSDNIPGVKGIGEVSATQLLSKYHTLAGLYEALEKGETDDLKPAMVEKLRTHKADADLSYQLATIRRDAPVTLDLAACQLELQHPEHLVGLFKELGFKSLLNELPGTQRLAAEAHDVFSAPTEEVEEPVHQGPKSRSEEIDDELAPTLREMEARGVKVDMHYLKKLEKEFDEEITDLKKKLTELAGEEFNPDSPSQVSHILYEVLAIPTKFIRKGKTGFTTDASTLQELAKEYPICGLLLTYREITKLQNTYIRPLQEIGDENNRIHTSYAPDTATGRISSRNPNLQNIPVKTEQGRRIRQAFIPEKGFIFLAADYSQMELRVAAHLSKDEALIETFKKGGDFHAETAAKMGVDRRTAKMINFSILYGKGAYGFSQDLGIPVAEAKEYIETYFKTFPKLRAFLDATLEFTRKNGYAETLYDRRRYLPDILSSNFLKRSAAEREALNLPIQGTQADILKEAMVNLAKRLEKTPFRLILTVHDELVLEVPEEKLHEAAAILKEEMVNVITLAVPIEVEVKSGKNWAEVIPLES